MHNGGQPKPRPGPPGPHRSTVMTDSPPPSGRPETAKMAAFVLLRPLLFAIGAIGLTLGLLVLLQQPNKRAEPQVAAAPVTPPTAQSPEVTLPAALLHMVARSREASARVVAPHYSHIPATFLHDGDLRGRSPEWSGALRVLTEALGTAPRGGCDGQSGGRAVSKLSRRDATGAGDVNLGPRQSARSPWGESRARTN